MQMQKMREVQDAQPLSCYSNFKVKPATWVTYSSCGGLTRLTKTCFGYSSQIKPFALRLFMFNYGVLGAFFLNKTYFLQKTKTCLKRHIQQIISWRAKKAFSEGWCPLQELPGVLQRRPHILVEIKSKSHLFHFSAVLPNMNKNLQVEQHLGSSEKSQTKLVFRHTKRYPMVIPNLHIKIYPWLFTIHVDFHQLGPLGRVGLVVDMSVCVFVWNTRKILI